MNEVCRFFLRVVVVVVGVVVVVVGVVVVVVGVVVVVVAVIMLLIRVSFMETIAMIFLCNRRLRFEE